MKIHFACRSCGAAGAVDAALAGTQVRCKHCGDRFTIPNPTEVDAEVYTLDKPIEETAGGTVMKPEIGSTFIPSRGNEPTSASTPRRPKRAATGSTHASSRERRSEFAWRTWLIRGGAIAVLVLTPTALLAPSGMLIVGSVLTVLGSVMVLLGFGVGAYGAFREDFLYGFIYVLFPLYAAYYFVTRWDDLWVWFACSTAGVAIIVLGTGLLQWGGVSM